MFGMMDLCSPTVTDWYRQCDRPQGQDRNWFKENGGDFKNGLNPNGEIDDDGYDKFGFSDSTTPDYLHMASYCDGEGPDRAGFTREDYKNNAGLFQQIEEEWQGTQLPSEQKKDFSTSISNSDDVDMRLAIVEIIKSMIVWYNQLNGRLPVTVNSKFHCNELGYRIHLGDISCVIPGEQAERVNGLKFFSNGKEHVIHYDKMSRWFTINEN